MKQIETTFKKNDLIYEMVERTHNVGLFKLFINESWMNEPEHCGWEVSLIKCHEAFEIMGTKIESGESITSDNRFGFDGSKAFFPANEKDAFSYFNTLSQEIKEQKALKITHPVE